MRAAQRLVGYDPDLQNISKPFYERHNGRISKVFKEHAHCDDWLSRLLVENIIASIIQVGVCSKNITVKLARQNTST